MTRTRTALPASVLVLVVGGVLAACGSSGSAGPGTTSTGPAQSASPTTAAATAVPSACKVVTAEAVTAALGTAPATPPATDAANQCTYSDAGGGNYVNVTLETGQTSETFSSAAAAGGGTQPVAGLGDRALQSSSGDSIFVLKGGTYLRIDVFTTASPSAVVQLARTAVAQLPG